MLRSQKDLSLKIGPFAIVGLEAFVQVPILHIKCMYLSAHFMF